MVGAAPSCSLEEAKGQLAVMSELQEKLAAAEAAQAAKQLALEDASNRWESLYVSLVYVYVCVLGLCFPIHWLVRPVGPSREEWPLGPLGCQLAC